jgi:sugar/nucleoside kinase (ribokinase family)
MNVPGDSRTFFYNQGTNDLISEDHIPVEALAGTGARLFYLGYIGLLGRLDALEADGGSGTARVLARARAAGMVTCADLVSMTSEHFAAVVRAALPHLDYLFLNEVEAARAAGVAVNGPGDAAALTAAAEALRAGGAGAVIVHTPELGLWCGAGGVTLAPVRPLPAEEIVSPVGAGDAFCAGVLFGIYHGWGVGDCLALGQRAAAACLTGASATEGLRPLGELMPEHPALRGDG